MEPSKWTSGRRAGDISGPGVWVAPGIRRRPPHAHSQYADALKRKARGYPRAFRLIKSGLHLRCCVVRFTLNRRFRFFLAHAATAEQEPGRVLQHYFVLEPHQAIEKCLRSRRTSWNVYINWNDSIHTLQSRIGWERAAG